ncbi:diaminopimelate decarboxylase [Desulfurobacterium atlanticum]|uniref:Diaminopimelate decarboxylase n=1 Tax=Desulfurobacterium atlanticum TaxID=240169 RepID=A0A238YN28_9BACT|nr:diaminopimelate decarboxylase [Desulfurobacterium atlanticum]SNR71839.1 diaminopimelate decarboxylase [Desulfurobacterium atlanticum]
MELLFPFIGYRNDELYVEECAVKDIGNSVGTPVYIYSKAAFEYWFKEFDGAFDEVERITAFAVKSCSNLAILRLLSELGAGADTVSAGEIFRTITAGIPSEKIVFAGVGKREDEMEYALSCGILMFNVESEDELDVLNSVAEKLGKVARIALRVNPDVDPKTHPYISTGLKTSKFGVDIERAYDIYLKAKNLKFVEPVGVHFHIGSQITDVSPFDEAAGKVADLVKVLRDKGIEIEYFDAGGGLGINYKPDEEVPSAKSLAEKIVPYVKELGCKLITEPGRRISGNSGILLTKLLYVKRNDRKTFYIVDAGMNDCMRPSLYNAYHHIVPVVRGDSKEIVDIVGPVCETGDVFAFDRKIGKCKKGDYLAILSAGAYGFTMASNYNSRLRPAEVLVFEDRFSIIRDRDSFGDLIKGEKFFNR